MSLKQAKDNRIAELEKENEALKAHVEKGWIDLLEQMRHHTDIDNYNEFEQGWSSCMHLLDHMAFEMMGKLNVEDSLARHDKETAITTLKSLYNFMFEMPKDYARARSIGPMTKSVMAEVIEDRIKQLKGAADD